MASASKDGKDGAEVPLFGQQRPQNFHRMSLALLILFPTLVFSTLTIAFAYVFPGAPAVVWTLVLFYLVVSVLFMMLKQTREGTPRFWFNIGLLCLIACLVAIGIGRSIVTNELEPYWAYEGQRMYTNVLPDQPAAEYGDAGRIIFSPDAKLDLNKSASYTKSSQIFCVAPVVGKTIPYQIQFWAAGVQCCPETEGFNCDEAKNEEAHAGLIYLPEIQLSNWFDNMKQAVNASKLPSAQDALFVKWVKNPDKVMRSYYHTAMGYLFISNLCYLVLATLCGGVLHFGRRAKKVPA